MKRNHKKSFDWYSLNQRYSLRKYHFGVASVLLGVALTLGGESAYAEENTTINTVESALVQVTEDDEGTKLQTSEEGQTNSLLSSEMSSSAPLSENNQEELTISGVQPTSEVAPEASLDSVVSLIETSEEVQEVAVQSDEILDSEVADSQVATSESATVGVEAILSEDLVSPTITEYEAELIEEEAKTSTTTISAEALIQLSPAEIYALTRHELSGFNMTKEIFESLTEDQIRALTFNRDYQAVARANNQDLQSGFRVDTGGQSGYTITPPMNTQYPNDPVAGRFTHTVVQSGDYYFTLSAEKPVLSGDELEKRVSDVYITAFDKNHRQLGEAVHRSTQTSGGLIDAFLKYNNTRITVTTDGVSVEGDGGLKRVYAHSGNNDPDAVFGSLSISLPRYTKQVTRYLKASDRKNPVREDYYQEGWEYSDYTTQPVTPIEFEGKTYTWDQVLPPNQNGKTGKLGQPYYKGDVNYIRARATAYANGPFVTVYQKREYIDNNGTMLVTVYATPRDSSTNPSVPSAEEFFQNMDKYTVYTDKMYGFNNTTGANIVNDVNAFYAAHMTGSDISVAANLKEPIIQTVKKEESFRNRFPMTEGGINTTGNITLRNRWDESSAVIYYYNSTGSVYVTYKDVDGNVLKVPQGGAYVDRVTDTGNVLPGTDYSTDDHKLNTIKTEDGRTYKLAPAGTYSVGVVDTNNHLTSSDAVTGKVEEGVDKTATYIYQEVKGDVVVLYRVNGTNAPITGISSDGKTIGNITNTQTEEKTAWEGAVIDTAATSTGTNYSTTDNRPSKITTADGKVYKRVENRVGGTEEGKVVEGTTRIVYYYELAKGNVVVNYVDENGTVLQPPVSDETNADTGKAYDTSDNKPATITSNGKVYELVPAGNYPVGKVDANNHLESSDPTTGKVEEGTKNVTYVYRLKEEPKGSVVVHYKDTEGNTIKDSVNDETDKPVGENYTTTDNKPEVIQTPEGKKYKLVPDRTQGEETGKIVEGTKEVTYVYQQVGGAVNARYVIEGTETELQVPAVVKPADSPVGEDYTATKPTEIVKDGKTYVLSATKPVRDSQGDAPETGKVTEGEQTVVYQYVLKEEPVPEVKKGNVVVHYVNEAGETIAADVEDTPESDVDTPYDTTDNKPKIIEKDGKRYIFSKVQDGDQETGKVVEGTTNVTYVYKELGKYIPYIPETPGGGYDPNKPGTDEPPVPYDETPEEPSDNPPLPYIPGYEPKVPGTTEPLKPVDPEDPTKGYIPPPIVVPNNPGVDNPVPYEPIAPNVTETMMPEENKNSIQSLPETGDSNDMLAPTLGIVFLGLLGINLKKKKD